MNTITKHVDEKSSAELLLDKVEKKESNSIPEDIKEVLGSSLNRLVFRCLSRLQSSVASEEIQKALSFDRSVNITKSLMELYEAKLVIKLPAKKGVKLFQANTHYIDRLAGKHMGGSVEKPQGGGKDLKPHVRVMFSWFSEEEIENHLNRSMGKCEIKPKGKVPHPTYDETRDPFSPQNFEQAKKHVATYCNHLEELYG